jgi:hypothetical protein
MAIARRTLPLDPRPADVVAAERAEASRLAEAGRAVEAMLLDRLGSTWPTIYGTAAQALAEPAVLRVLLGEPRPGPAASPEYIAELRAAAEDREAVLEHLGENDCTPIDGETLAEAVERLARTGRAEILAELGEALGIAFPIWPDMLARVRLLVTGWREMQAKAREPVTAIDDTTPEGVLALLDAALDALKAGGFPLAHAAIEQARDEVADWHGLPLRDQAGYTAHKVDRLAARLGLDKPRRTDALDAQVESLTGLDGSVLLARLHRLVASTDETIANPSSGWSESRHLTMLAAICLALAAKLSTDSTGGAF